MSELDDLARKLRDQKREEERLWAAWLAAGVSEHDPPLEWPPQDIADLVRDFVKKVPRKAWKCERFRFGTGPDGIARVHWLEETAWSGTTKGIGGIQVFYKSGGKSSDEMEGLWVFEDGRLARVNFGLDRCTRGQLLPWLAAALARF